MIFDTLLFDTLLFDTLSFDTLLFDTLLFDTLSFDTLSFDTLLFDTLLFDTLPFDTLSFDTLSLTKNSLSLNSTLSAAGTQRLVVLAVVEPHHRLLHQPEPSAAPVRHVPEVAARVGAALQAEEPAAHADGAALLLHGLPGEAKVARWYIL
jgi:hypothetical protein